VIKGNKPITSTMKELSNLPQMGVVIYVDVMEESKIFATSTCFT
jgi:hypothetical protein